MLSSMISLVLTSWALIAAHPAEGLNRQTETENIQWLEVQDEILQREDRIVRDYFIEVTGNEEVVDAVLTASDAHDIPVTLAFALARKESSFNTRDLSSNATSVDRGLFQLNSLSFPHLSNEDCFDPWLNADTGLSYLRYCWDRGGNATVALAMYNAGPTRVENQGTPAVTMTYIHKIYSFQDSYEEEIRKRLVLDLESPIDSPKTVKNMGSFVEQL